MAALALTAACCLGQAIDYSLRDAERLRKHLILDTYIDSGAPKREPPSPPIEGTLTPLGAPHTLRRSCASGLGRPGPGAAGPAPAARLQDHHSRHDLGHAEAAGVEAPSMEGPAAGVARK